MRRSANTTRSGASKTSRWRSIEKGEEERNRKNVLRQRKERKTMKNENLASNRYLDITFNQMKPTTINVT